jgi:thiamine biosynthesis lipoprotein
VLDPAARTIFLPDGAGIDLGGIGKGFAVDRLAAILGTPCLVNGGGDVFVAGRPHDAPAWHVGIEDPFAPDRDLRVVETQDRAVATSTTLRRRWQTEAATAHHLIDTRTGDSSQTDAVQVSIVAPTALLADYHATVALLLGVDEGLRYVNKEIGIEGLIVTRDGDLHESGGLAAYLREAT